MLSLIETGNLQVRIGTSYPLADVGGAHDDLESRRSDGKFILLP